ncbi:LysM peptidoglycan-binding domain-containing protein [Cellulomonas sp. URHB0016]
MTALVTDQPWLGRAPGFASSVRRAGRPPAGRASTPAGDGPLRLTARGRIVLGVLTLLVVGAGIVPWQAGRASADGPSGAVEVVRHVVQPGETLWGIAREVAGPGDDVRDVVVRLVELNNLPSAGLMAGQSIVVPVA